MKAWLLIAIWLHLLFYTLQFLYFLWNNLLTFFLTEWQGTGMVICLEWGAHDLHMIQLMPLPPTISSFIKNRMILPFWCWLTQVVLDQRPLNRCSVVVILPDWSSIHSYTLLSTAPHKVCFVLDTHGVAVQSAVSHVICPSVRPSVCLSVCDVGGSWPHRLKILETNCTNN